MVKKNRYSKQFIAILTVVKLIKCYANNVVFTHGISLCQLKYCYKLLDVSIFLCYLLIHIRTMVFFLTLIMNSWSFANHSKTSALKKFKRLLYKSYPRFSTICKNSMHLNQFLVLLYNIVPNLRHSFGIHKFLKNANVSKTEMGKNLTTALYSGTTSLNFSGNKDCKNQQKQQNKQFF